MILGNLASSRPNVCLGFSYFCTKNGYAIIIEKKNDSLGFERELKKIEKEYLSS